MASDDNEAAGTNTRPKLANAVRPWRLKSPVPANQQSINLIIYIYTCRTYLTAARNRSVRCLDALQPTMARARSGGQLHGTALLLLHSLVQPTYPEATDKLRSHASKTLHQLLLALGKP